MLATVIDIMPPMLVPARSPKNSINPRRGSMSRRGMMGAPATRRRPRHAPSSQALPGSLSSQVPMIDKPEARRFPLP